MAITDPFNEDVLFKAYREAVVNEIEKQLLADVRPRVRDAAEAAGRALEGRLIQRHDHLRDKLIVNVELLMKEINS